MLPLFSPARSVVVYILGKAPCAAKASESIWPLLTRSRTLSSKVRRYASFCRLISNSSDVRIRVPVLQLLQQMASLVRHLYQKFRHTLAQLPPSRQSNIQNSRIALQLVSRKGLHHCWQCPSTPLALFKPMTPNLLYLNHLK